MKKKRKRKPIQVLGPTPERMAKGGFDLVATERAGVKAHRVQIVDLYDLYHRQGKLARDEHSACEHFARVHRQARGADCQISRYDKGIGGGAGVGQQIAEVAMGELARHMGRQLTWIVGTVIEGERMRPLERRMGVRNGQGFGHLHRAIRAMTTFWGLTNASETHHESRVDTGTTKRDNVKS